MNQRSNVCIKFLFRLCKDVIYTVSIFFYLLFFIRLHFCASFHLVWIEFTAMNVWRTHKVILLFEKLHKTFLHTSTVLMHLFFLLFVVRIEIDIACHQCVCVCFLCLWVVQVHWLVYVCVCVWGVQNLWCTHRCTDGNHKCHGNHTMHHVHLKFAYMYHFQHCCLCFLLWLSCCNRCCCCKKNMHEKRMNWV